MQYILVFNRSKMIGKSRVAVQRLLAELYHNNNINTKTCYDFIYYAY